MGWLPSRPHTDASSSAEAEDSAVAALRALLAARAVDAGDRLAVDAGDLSRSDLIRFLRARKLHLGKSADFLIADLTWRRDCRIKERSAEDGAAVLGCDLTKLQAILPHASGGVDRQGRPLLFKHFGGQCEIRKMLKDTTLRNMEDYNWWLNERHVRRLDELGQVQWIVIIDAKNWSPTLFDSTAYKFLKSMAKIDSDHYPERLGGMVVVNAPAALAFCWRVVRTWLDEATRDKVEIFSSGDGRRARETLLRMADPSELPEQYCGSAAPLAAWPAWPARSGLPAPKAGA